MNKNYAGQVTHTPKNELSEKINEIVQTDINNLWEPWVLPDDSAISYLAVCSVKMFVEVLGLHNVHPVDMLPRIDVFPFNPIQNRDKFGSDIVKMFEYEQHLRYQTVLVHSKSNTACSVSMINKEECISKGMLYAEPILIFNAFRFREPKIPLHTTKIMKWLHNLQDKEMRKGRGAKEYALGGFYSTLGCTKPLMIPAKRINYVAQAIDWTHNPLALPFMSMISHPLVANIAPDQNMLFKANQLVLSYRTFEITDTPTWVMPSEDLTISLLNTEVKEIKEDYLQLPMPSIFIETQTKSFAVGKETHPMFYMTIHKEHEETCSSLAFSAVFIDRFARECLEAHWYIHTNEKGIFDVDVLDRITTNENFTDCTIFNHEISSNDLFKKITLFGANLMLYINSPNAPIVKSKQSKKKKTKVDGKRQEITLSEYEQWVTGTNVELSEEDKDRLKSTSVFPASTIDYGRVTRGHWRNQACGPNWSEHKLIWIAPYVRGKKDFADRVISHTYHTDSL